MDLKDFTIFYESNETLGVLYDRYRNIPKIIDIFLDDIESSVKVTLSNPEKDLSSLLTSLKKFKDDVSFENKPIVIGSDQIKEITKSINDLEKNTDKILKKFVKLKDKISFGGNLYRAIIRKPRIYSKDIDEERYRIQNANIRAINRSLDWVEKTFIDIYNLMNQDKNILQLIDKVYISNKIYEYGNDLEAAIGNNDAAEIRVILDKIGRLEKLKAPDPVIDKPKVDLISQFRATLMGESVYIENNFNDIEKYVSSYENNVKIYEEGWKDILSKGISLVKKAYNKLVKIPPTREGLSMLDGMMRNRYFGGDIEKIYSEAVELHDEKIKIIHDFVRKYGLPIWVVLEGTNEYSKMSARSAAMSQSVISIELAKQLTESKELIGDIRVNKNNGVEIIKARLDFPIQSIEDFNVVLLHEYGHYKTLHKFTKKDMLDHMVKISILDLMMDIYARSSTISSTQELRMLQTTIYHNFPVEKAADDYVGINHNIYNKMHFNGNIRSDWKTAYAVAKLIDAKMSDASRELYNEYSTIDPYVASNKVHKIAAWIEYYNAFIDYCPEDKKKSYCHIALDELEKLGWKAETKSTYTENILDMDNMFSENNINWTSILNKGIKTVSKFIKYFQNIITPPETLKDVSTMKSQIEIIQRKRQSGIPLIGTTMSLQDPTDARVESYDIMDDLDSLMIYTENTLSLDELYKILEDFCRERGIYYIVANNARQIGEIEDIRSNIFCYTLDYETYQKRIKNATRYYDAGPNHSRHGPSKISVIVIFIDACKSLINTRERVLMILKHEYGHIITRGKYTIYDRLDYAMRCDFLAKIDFIVGMSKDVSMCKDAAYYNFKLEKDANDAAGLNYKEILELMHGVPFTQNIESMAYYNIATMPIPRDVLDIYKKSFERKSLTSEESIRMIEFNVQMYEKCIPDGKGLPTARKLQGFLNQVNSRSGEARERYIKGYIKLLNESTDYSTESYLAEDVASNNVETSNTPTVEEPKESIPDSSSDKSLSYPKQADKAESDKNGVRRKKLYIAFIEWAKAYNSKNAFGSIFDKDAFDTNYSFVPHELRYFYRLANPLMCVLSGKLTFFAVSELRKLNMKNSLINERIIFAATDKDLRIFNIKDKKVYLAKEENGMIKIDRVLGNTFDTYLQNMIGQGDILNAPLEESADELPLLAP